MFVKNAFALTCSVAAVVGMMPNVAKAQSQYFYASSGLPAGVVRPTITETIIPGTTEALIDIQFPIASNVSIATLEIRPNGPDRKIRQLTITATGGSTQFRVPFLAVSIIAPDRLTLGRSITRVDNVSALTGSRPISLSIAGVGQIGSISQPASIGANSISNIIVTNDAPGYSGNVYGSIASIREAVVPGLTQLTPNFEEPVRIAGDLNGTLIADNQFSGEILVDGNIGTPATPATIQARVIRAIEADNIHANILTASTNATDLIGRVTTRTGGDFTGSLITTSLKPSQLGGDTTAFIDIARDLDANITVRDDIARESGTLANPLRTIRVGRNFKAGRTISIGGTLQGPNSLGQWLGGIRIGGTEGLKGQVIINADNTTGQWQGGIAVPVIDPLGSTVTETLGAASAYAIPNAKLGNGSVGLVPYQLHGPSSSPPNGQLGDPTSIDDLTNTDIMSGQSIALEFYGPVQLPTSGAPVKVVVTGLCNGGLPDVTQNFSYSVSGRRLLITKNPDALFPYNYVPSGTFRVTNAASGGLLCEGLNVPVAAFSYEFRLHTDCNNDGSPVLANGQPEGVCGSTGFCDSIDFNRNGVYPEEQDVTDFVNVVAGGACPYAGTCDIDFNNNGTFPEDQDYQDFLDVIAGDCLTCYPE